MTVVTSNSDHKNEMTLDQKVQLFKDAAESSNSKRAMADAVKHFTVKYGAKLPCTSEDLSYYLACYAGTLSTSTLELRSAMLGKWHIDNGFPTNPNKSKEVKKIMRGIRKKHAKRPKQSNPIMTSTLIRLVDFLNDRIMTLNNVTGLKGLQKAEFYRCLRNRSMILTSFWFGLRSDELLNMNLGDLKFYMDSSPCRLEIYIPRSKTDKQAVGVTKKISELPSYCPLRANLDWHRALRNAFGDKRSQPLYPKINRGGAFSTTPIHRTNINSVYDDMFKAAGIKNENYTSHSFRRGIASALTEAGSTTKQLMDWIGWNDERSAMRYQSAAESLPSKMFDEMMKIAGLDSSLANLGSERRTQPG